MLQRTEATRVPPVQEPDLTELRAGLQGVQGHLLAPLTSFEHPRPPRSQNEEGVRRVSFGRDHLREAVVAFREAFDHPLPLVSPG